MLPSYRALLVRHGAGWLAFACALAWLSFTGYSLAIILAVHAATRSFAVAGMVVAAFSVGSGVAAPVRGRLVDTRGPRALALLAGTHGLAFALLVVGCATRSSSVALAAAAGVAGVFAPPLIATARAAWTQVAGADLAGTAHALNASLADVAQLLSPALTGVVAALASPVVALAGLLTGAMAAASVVVGGGEGRPGHEARPRTHRVGGVIVESAGLRTVVMCDVGIGVWVGALEVAVTAVAARAGAAALGAVLLSASAVGSILVSLLSGGGRISRPPAWRYIVGCFTVAGALLLTVAAHSLPALAVIVALSGAGFGLLGVALFELLDHVVPANRAVEAFTWLTTGQAAGTALGASTAGQLARSSPTAALYLVAVAAVAVAVVAVVRRRTLEVHDG
jgi:MFS family permease